MSILKSQSSKQEFQPGREVPRYLSQVTGHGGRGVGLQAVQLGA